MVLLAGTPAAPASAAGGPPYLHAPLASALSTPQGSWAVVAMGDLGQLTNTFWELFFRAPGGTSWKLVTPPGVADNGGLTVAIDASGTTTVGFEASQRLRSSPLALSSDDGSNWGPALVPTALAVSPDALALGSGGHTALALVRRGSGEVLQSTAQQMAWTPTPGASMLRDGSSPACRIDGLTAVALGAGSVPMVGTGCRRAGQVGVFVRTGSRWKLTGPVLHAAGIGATSVLRLDSSGGPSTALVVGARRGGAAVVALWLSATGTWSQSPALSVGAGRPVLSSAVADGGEQVVLLGQRPSGAEVETVAVPGLRWTRVADPPPGTRTVAPSGNGSIAAFAVHGSELRVFTLSPGAHVWALTQRMSVDIAYGSS